MPRSGLSLKGAITRCEGAQANDQILTAAVSLDDWDVNWDQWDDIDEWTNLDLPWPN